MILSVYYIGAILSCCCHYNTYNKYMWTVSIYVVCVCVSLSLSLFRISLLLLLWHYYICVGIKNVHTMHLHLPIYFSDMQSSLRGSVHRCWLPNNFGFEFKCAFIFTHAHTHTLCPLLTFMHFHHTLYRFAVAAAVVAIL